MPTTQTKAGERTQLQVGHSEAIVRALQVLDFLGNYIECGAEKIYFSALMPDNGRGIGEDVTFEDAVRAALEARTALRICGNK